MTPVALVHIPAILLPIDFVTVGDSAAVFENRGKKLKKTMGELKKATSLQQEGFIYKKMHIHWGSINLKQDPPPSFQCRSHGMGGHWIKTLDVEKRRLVEGVGLMKRDIANLGSLLSSLGPASSGGAPDAECQLSPPSPLPFTPPFPARLPRLPPRGRSPRRRRYGERCQIVFSDVGPCLRVANVCGGLRIFAKLLWTIDWALPNRKFEIQILRLGRSISRKNSKTL